MWCINICLPHAWFGHTHNACVCVLYVYLCAGLSIKNALLCLWKFRTDAFTFRPRFILECDTLMRCMYYCGRVCVYVFFCALHGIVSDFPWFDLIWFCRMEMRIQLYVLSKWYIRIMNYTTHQLWHAAKLDCFIEHRANTCVRTFTNMEVWPHILAIYGNVKTYVDYMSANWRSVGTAYCYTVCNAQQLWYVIYVL